MTLALSGQVVEAGIAIGQAHIIRANELEIGEFKIPAEEIDAEIARLERALAESRDHLKTLAARLGKSTGTSAEEIIRTHIAMLDDSSLGQVAAEHIREHLCNAEWALQLRLEALLEEFRSIDDAYIRSREEDIVQVVRMVQQGLAAEQVGRPLGDLPDRLGDTLAVASELTPGELAALHERGVAGVVTEHGSPYSHTAILARTMGIPTVMGVRRAQSLVTESEQLILDGHYGVVFADPGESILRHYLQKQSESRGYREALKGLRNRPATSLDGTAITLLANAERIDDIERARADGAEGIGLYRSEYLFLRGEPPDEEQQLRLYSEALEALGGATLTIRTLDIGADKTADLLNFETLRSAANPALGLRAVRLCLREMELFKSQLRAILRTSALGPVRCLIPMLTSETEVRAVRTLLNEARYELQGSGHAYDEEMPVGGMIEVPAAALGLDALGRDLDFVSIGTNDLIQYALAADRLDEHVAHLYDPLHPGMIFLLTHIFETASKMGVPVSVCGEMAGDRRFTRLLLGLGLTEFSMQPRSLLEIKKVITETDIGNVRASLAEWRASGDLRGCANLIQYLDKSQLHH